MRPVADGEGTQTALKMQFEPMKANHGRTRHPTSVTIVLRLPAPALLPFPSAASSEGGDLLCSCLLVKRGLGVTPSIANYPAADPLGKHSAPVQHPSPQQSTGGEGRGCVGRGRVTLPCPSRAAPRLGGGHHAARGLLLHQVSEKGPEGRSFCLPLASTLAPSKDAAPWACLCPEAAAAEIFASAMWAAVIQPRGGPGQ